MKSSKKLLVLEHLKKHGEITPRTAYELYGCMRLAVIIFELRKEYDIETVHTATLDRYGNKVNYATYILKEEG